MDLTSPPPTRRLLHRLLAVAIGFSFGGILGVGLWCAWRTLSPPPRTITKADYRAVARQLDDAPRGIFMFDERTSYRYKPNFKGLRPIPNVEWLADRANAQFIHETNSLGLLGAAEVVSDRSVSRVLLVGDSVTYGAWVDYPSTFAGRIAASSDSMRQVYVAACEGWSTKQELTFLDERLSAIDWQEVLLVVCLNDLVNFEWKYQSSERFQLAEELVDLGGLGVTNESAAGLRLAMVRARFAANDATRPLSRQNNTTLWAWDEDRWKWYFETILDPYVQRPDRPPLSIAVAPTRSQLESIDLGADPESVFYPQAMLMNYCGKRRLRFVDIADAFVGPSNQNRAEQFLSDLHFSETGHEIVADYLGGVLRAMAKSERMASKPPKRAN